MFPTQPGMSLFRSYLFPADYQTWLGVDETVGPVALSFLRDGRECAGGVGNGLYRFIVRTSSLQTIRGSVPEDVIAGNKQGEKAKSIHAKDILEFICPELSLHK